MAKINWRSKKGGYQLPPEGTFDLIVKEAAVTTGNDDQVQVVVRYEIAEGTHTGASFRQYYTLSEERGWVFRKTCEALGLEVQDHAAADDACGEYDLDTDDLLNRYMRATITLNRNEARGKTYVNLSDEQPSQLQARAEGQPVAASAPPTPAPEPRRPPPRP